MLAAGNNIHGFGAVFAEVNRFEVACEVGIVAPGVDAELAAHAVRTYDLPQFKKSTDHISGISSVISLPSAALFAIPSMIAWL